MKALYNKYRPSCLDTVRGQDHVKRVLTSQVQSGETLNAYIFSGSAGTGKTTCARILAAMLNCSTGATTAPPPEDPHVKMILSGKCAMDVYEIDAATNNGIDSIRALRDKACFAPMKMAKKIYIIDECHRLTPQAWDGLLKIIEEPPEHLVFIFCTTESDKISETIRTRCMVLDFRALSHTDMMAELHRIAESEGTSLSDEVLRMIVGAARGSMRQAINWLGGMRQAGGSITPELVMQFVGATPRQSARDFVLAVLSADYPSALAASAVVLAAGARAEDYLSEVARFCHDVIMYGGKGYDFEALGYSKADVADVERARRLATESVGPEYRNIMLKWVHTLQECTGLTIYNMQPQFTVDTAFVEMLSIAKLYKNRNT